MRRTFLLTGLLFSLAGAAVAGSLSDPVPGRPGVTSFDLARLVVPDLARTSDGASGSKVRAFRHIEGKGMLAQPQEPIALGDGAVSVIAVPGRPDRLMALIDLGGSDGNVEEAELLALYALGPKLRLLDVVGVGNDRWTAVEDNPPLLA